MSDFEKQIHAMFDHIWDCDINHPIFEDTVGELMDAVIQCYNILPLAEPERKPISYQDCSNAMLMMWMDNVITDGEYNRIMDKLNAKHMAERKSDE